MSNKQKRVLEEEDSEKEFEEGEIEIEEGEIEIEDLIISPDLTHEKTTDKLRCSCGITFSNANQFNNHILNNKPKAANKPANKPDKKKRRVTKSPILEEDVVFVDQDENEEVEDGNENENDESDNETEQQTSVIATVFNRKDIKRNQK